MPIPDHIILSRRIAIGWFFFWLIILFAGADFPPPPGFLLLVVIDAVAAYLVYRRISTYQIWVANKVHWRTIRAILDGMLAGITISLLMILLPGSGEPSVQPVLTDYLIWCVVLTAVGAINSISIFWITALISRKYPAP